MDPAAAKQQIAERVKQASRFLVTVNANPTVDQLAACIGLTLLINKMNKHATAVFSGKIPSTIEFLQPEKTIEPNPDSLRDFIISLDKNKADKLRYKVEDDVVRIYITPYRTSLSENDFVFSEGDFNVEVVIALGVSNRTNLDQSITAHGRILHDATVISLNTGPGKAPDLGQINWQDTQASSLSEMLVSISEAFGPGLIDSQIATAFLTGIVAETQRFANKKTTPKVMTMSAQMMAAGANQQLIVSKLEPPPPPPSPREPKKPAPPPLKPEGIIEVPKDDKSNGKADIDLGTTEIHIDEQGNIKTKDGKINNDAMAAPSPLSRVPAEMPAPAPLAPPVEPPASPHAFMGSTAQPADNETPFSAATEQPNWAQPYETVPTDPLRDSSDNTGLESSASSQPPAVEEPVQAKVTPLDSPLDNARNAVESALSKASYDPAFNPIDSLNAQPLPEQPLVEQTVQEPDHEEPLAPTPPPAAGDTPVLNLPFNSDVAPTPFSPVPPTPPPLNTDTLAPPPAPPPLMAAPGAVIPNPPQQQ